MALTGCDAQPHEASSELRLRVPMWTTPIVQTDGSPAPHVAAICYALDVRDDQGNVIVSAPPELASNLDVARQDGAWCIDASAERLIDCVPGRRYFFDIPRARFYLANHEALEEDERPYGLTGAARSPAPTAVCERGRTVDVPLGASDTWTIMRLNHQGFVDLDVDAGLDAGLANVCYALRVDNGAGDALWGGTGLCSDEYGLGHGNLQYVGVCDASSNENTLSLWVTGIYREDGSALEPSEYRDPCAAEDRGDGPIETWQGGCRKTFKCVENEDTRLTHTLELRR